MNNLLTIKNLNKHYFIKKEIVSVLKDINLTVDENEIIAIVGKSGCGKSTLLSIISGLIDYTSGDIIKKKNLSFGYMFQTDTLFPWLTVKENALLGVNLKKMPNQEEKLDLLLKKYHLFSDKDKYPSSLSGGMKKRVSLISSILINPDILLLDEPFSALDYYTRIQIANDVYQLVRKEHKSMIIVTHDIEEAVSMADRVIILDNTPSTITHEIIINRYNCSPIEFRKQSTFFNYTNQIWELLNHA